MLKILLTFLIIFAEPLVAQNDKQSCDRKRTERENMNHELSEAARNVVRVLKTGDGAGFLRLASQQGVVFGIDDEAIPLNEMRQQIQNKRGVHCLLFDTSCLQKQLGFKRFLSFQELLTKAGSIEIKTGVVSDTTTVAGTVRVIMSGKIAQQALGTNTLEFEFVREGRTWKLTAIPY